MRCFGFLPVSIIGLVLTAPLGFAQIEPLLGTWYFANYTQKETLTFTMKGKEIKVDLTEEDRTDRHPHHDKISNVKLHDGGMVSFTGKRYGSYDYVAQATGDVLIVKEEWSTRNGRKGRSTSWGRNEATMLAEVRQNRAHQAEYERENPLDDDDSSQDHRTSLDAITETLNQQIQARGGRPTIVAPTQPEPSRRQDPASAVPSVPSSRLQIVQVNALPTPVRADQQATLSFSVLDANPNSTIEWKVNCDLMEIVHVNATSRLSFQSRDEVRSSDARSGSAVILTLQLKREQGGTRQYGGTVDCYINAKTQNSAGSNSSDFKQARLTVVPAK